VFGNVPEPGVAANLEHSHRGFVPRAQCAAALPDA
jgi:hypothetical protein